MSHEDIERICTTITGLGLMGLVGWMAYITRR